MFERAVKDFARLLYQVHIIAIGGRGEAGRASPFASI